MAGTKPEIVSSLQFQHSGNWTAGCTLVLRSDRTIQLIPSDSLQRELDGLLVVVGVSSQKWGASLVGILAVLGGAFYLRKHRGLALSAFLAAGIAGASAYCLRRYSVSIVPWLLSPIPVEAVTVELLDDDSLKIVIKDGRLRRFTAALEPNEFEATEALTFTEAFHAVRTNGKELLNQ